MASSSIANSKYFNKLSVNKLEVNNLKVNEEKQTQRSWLFSLIGNCEYNAIDNTLKLVEHDTLKLLGFTDRPYRKQINFDGYNNTLKPIPILELLFDEDNSIDSFSQDPPNAVLVMNNKQVVYELVHLMNLQRHLN